MNRELLAHLPVVLAVARRGGFAVAAAELGMSPSAVSHAVKTVEDQLGLPLFARTTRSVALTEAGHGFLDTVGPALIAIDEAAERVGAARGRVTGLLRLNIPRVALSIAITPVMVEMARRHPDLTIEITSDDGLVDVVAQGFDAGVRLGAMIAEDMIAVRLTPPFQAIMVASPAYLADRGTPRAIADLARHNCIGFRLLSSGAVYAWDLRDGGTELSVSVAGTARVTDPTYAKELALADIGIAYLFEPLARAELAAGTLVQLMPWASLDEPGLFLYFPRRAADAPKLRAFIDTAKEVLRATG
ncbi:MAG TPA: LysR family transcriptional regulator [Aliidongia sp.]|uniref:LysR family transcriptional regulator n=1 Tax=Aliidongia sp. TaxID=1914230 RepID=UPI002DDD7F3F|nr:LysR family transcriptional regulator [Aliidongia sp.]HEV2675512.1 LysR family transcriptional regulator [Aliidongia sp.]